MLVLETPRLALRHLAEGDAPFILRLLNDPAFLRFIGDRGVRTEADARAYLAAGPIESYHRHGHGLYAATLRDNGAPIGMCGLVRRDFLDEPDLGFALLPEYRAAGYTAEASTGVIAHAREHMGLARLFAITSLDNVASIRLLGKLGFELKQRLRRPPTDEEINLFSLSLQCGRV
jgi:[ribosomal protein S5]-alanine N-acetyltransferase